MKTHIPTNKRSCLVVGGPQDGKWVVIPIGANTYVGYKEQDFVAVLYPTPHEAEKHVVNTCHYHLRQFHEGGVVHNLLVAEGMETEGLIGHIFANYRPKVKGHQDCRACGGRGYFTKGGNSESNLDTEVCPRCFPS